MTAPASAAGLSGGKLGPVLPVDVHEGDPTCRVHEDFRRLDREDDGGHVNDVVGRTEIGLAFARDRSHREGRDRLAGEKSARRRCPLVVTWSLPPFALRD